MRTFVGVRGSPGFRVMRAPGANISPAAHRRRLLASIACIMSGGAAHEVGR